MKYSSTYSTPLKVSNQSHGPDALLLVPIQKVAGWAPEPASLDKVVPLLGTEPQPTA